MSAVTGSEVLMTIEMPSSETIKRCGTGCKRLVAAAGVTTVICVVALPILGSATGGYFYCRGQDDMSDCGMFALKLGCVGAFAAGFLVGGLVQLIDGVYAMYLRCHDAIERGENAFGGKTFTIVASDSSPEGYQPV